MYVTNSHKKGQIWFNTMECGHVSTGGVDRKGQYIPCLTCGTTTQELYQKYPEIVRWSKSLGSYDYYIEAQVTQAQEEDAPTNAIYRGSDGWVTTDDLKPGHPFLRPGTN